MEDMSRKEALRRDYSALRYTGNRCTNCGRERVELLVNGKRVCEKCFWDQDKEEYCEYT